MDLSNTEIAFQDHDNSSLKKRILLFKAFNISWLNRLGTTATQLAFQLGIPVSSLIRSTIYPFFCGGETLDECMQTVERLKEHGVMTNLDYAVEGKQSEADFDATVEEMLRGFDYSARYDSLTFCSLKVTGIARMDLLKKDFSEHSEEEKKEWLRVEERLERLCQKAKDSDVRLFIDAEETWIQPRIDFLALEAMRRHNSGNRALVYNTYQLYRKDALSELKRDYARAEKEGFLLGAKLVRGAYVEKENDAAKAEGRRSPMQPGKEATDRDFNLAVEFCLKEASNLWVCVASHNEKSIEQAWKFAADFTLEERGRVCFAQLYGMGDHLSFNLAHAGAEVGKYLPYGPVKEVIPYLVRRAQENSSIAGQMSRELTLLQKEARRRKL